MVKGKQNLPKGKKAGASQAKPSKPKTSKQGFSVGVKDLSIGPIRLGSAKASFLNAATPIRPSWHISAGGARDEVVVSALEEFSLPMLSPDEAISPNVLLASVLIHPSTVASTRTQTFSHLYTNYLFESFRLHYVPDISLANSGANGMVLVAFERDAADRLAVGSSVTSSELFSREGSTEFAVYSSACTDFVRTTPQTSFYVSTGGSDPRMTYQGAVYMMTPTGLSSTRELGRFFIEYRLRFFNPTNEAGGAAGRAGIWVTTTEGHMTSNFMGDFAAEVPLDGVSVVYDATIGGTGGYRLSFNSIGSYTVSVSVQLEEATLTQVTNGSVCRLEVQDTVDASVTFTEDGANLPGVVVESGGVVSFQGVDMRTHVHVTAPGGYITIDLDASGIMQNGSPVSAAGLLTRGEIDIISWPDTVTTYVSTSSGLLRKKRPICLNSLRPRIVEEVYSCDSVVFHAPAARTVEAVRLAEPRSRCSSSTPSLSAGTTAVGPRGAAIRRL